ncbi:Two pore calcium channel protein 1 [Fasciolopsis buskii]|uniref:Two pore calcium channel protein 1 n=1 Tax=Fasciolopsis buskii TaxID=27845 RepID=A0A8E0S4U7_9TREM|nr:Two pore calcium channel protein 1 [Fasciolopsis buski]
MEEDEEYLSARARRFVLGSTLMRDACVSRLEINYKRDLVSVKMYERFYSKYGVILFYVFTVVNLLTIVLEYPSSILIRNHELPYYIPLLINLICEGYFYFRWYMIHSMSEKGKLWENLSTKLTLVILVLMSVDAVIFVICQHVRFATPVRWSRGLRPILLLTFPENHRLRAAFFNLRRTAVDVLPVFCLFLATVIFSSIVALTMLTDQKLHYPNGKSYFPDFIDVFWDLYVLTTTANSPDVIIPAYESNRIFILLYIFICAICNWLFMGILTASVYNSYKAHLGEFVVTSVAKRKRKLDEAFFLVATRAPDGEAGISQGTFLRLMRIVKPRRSEDSLKVLFHILNKSRSGYLNLGEFGRLSEYMQAHLVEVELSRKYFQRFLPKFYDLYTSPRFQLFKQVVDHQVTKVFFISLVVANGITAVFCRSYPSIQTAIEWSFTLVFLLEVIINYLASGGVLYFEDGWNIFDCVIVVTALFGQILETVLTGIGVRLPTGITQMLLLLRLIRLLKVFSVVPKFRAVINCILTIIPSLLAYATILLILFYLYSCFGMEVFSYLYEPPPQHNYSTKTDCYQSQFAGKEFSAWHYCLFNFNSITEAFIMLLVLTVGNNWHVFAEGIELATNRWSRIFFLIIHWTCVLLVLNVVLAFIIEAFLIEYDAHASRFEVYIEEKLEEIGMNADTELAKRGIYDYRKPGFQITRKLLDSAFPVNSPRSKAFYLQSDTASIEILMFRMFEKEVEELLLTYRSSLRQPRFKAHDALATVGS